MANIKKILLPGSPQSTNPGPDRSTKTSFGSLDDIVNHVELKNNPQMVNKNLLYGGVTVNADLNGNIINDNRNSKYSGYTNPLTGNNKIFTREDIDSMSSDEYLQNEKAIHSQLNSIGIPTNGEMEYESMTNGGTVYVRPYTRSDGTQVRGYYRAR